MNSENANKYLLTYRSRPEIKLLMSAGQYQGILSKLRSIDQARCFALNSEGPGRIEIFLFSSVCRALRGPSKIERMTASRRRDLGEKISRTARKLRELISPLVETGEFTPLIRELSANAAIKYAWRKKTIPDRRATLYSTLDYQRVVRTFLTRDLDDVLLMIAKSGDDLGEIESILKKPNDKNSDRMYFLRTMTNFFLEEFGGPLRSVTLSLTSIYFDCSDIDEASLSRLAPVPKHKLTGRSEDGSTGAPMSKPVSKRKKSEIWCR